MGESFVLDQLLGGQRRGTEPPNGEDGAVHRERGNDGVDARAIGQPRVHHRRRFINPPPHTGDDLVDDLEQVAVIAESNARLAEHAATFHVHRAVGVHQDVVDGVVLEQLLKGPEAEDFVEDFLGDAVPL